MRFIRGFPALSSKGGVVWVDWFLGWGARSSVGGVVEWDGGGDGDGDLGRFLKFVGSEVDDDDCDDGSCDDGCGGGVDSELVKTAAVAAAA